MAECAKGRQNFVLLLSICCLLNDTLSNSDCTPYEFILSDLKGTKLSNSQRLRMQGTTKYTY
jgi:hypothetical protein